MIDADIKPDQITILLRNDRNGLLSKPIIETLKKYSVDVSLTTDSELANNKEYRTVLSIIRLLVDQNDCLAWRTLLQTNKANGLGDECIKSIWNYGQSKGIRFSVALQKIAESPTELQKFGQKIAKFVSEINAAIVELKAIESPIEAINATVDKFMGEGEIKEQVKKYFVGILENQEKPDLENLIKIVSTSSEYIEQETKENAVNILTMHQAKGLSFDVCFIVGAEDEYIPGRNTGDKEGDERRLLYVSMTRARHKLFISYCNKRTGQQRHSGSNSGTEKRTLTRFLRDSKIPIKQVE